MQPGSILTSLAQDEHTLKSQRPHLYRHLNHTEGEGEDECEGQHVRECEHARERGQERR